MSTSILSLPDEIIIEIIEWHIQSYGPKLTLVSKRFHQLSIWSLYRRVRLRNGLAIHRFLRSIIDNPGLAQHVSHLELEGGLNDHIGGALTWNVGVETETPNGTIFLDPKLEEVFTYEERNEFDQRPIDGLRTYRLRSIRSKTAVLLFSLPHLSSIFFHHHRLLDGYLTEFLLPILRCQGKLEMLCPNPSDLNQFSKAVSTANEYNPLHNLIPMLLHPMMRAVTAEIPSFAEGSSSVDPAVLLKTCAKISSVHTIHLINYWVDGEKLAPLLQFPRSLRALTLKPQFDDRSRFSTRPHFNSKRSGQHFR